MTTSPVQGKLHVYINTYIHFVERIVEAEDVMWLWMVVSSPRMIGAGWVFLVGGCYMYIHVSRGDGWLHTPFHPC